MFYNPIEQLVLEQLSAEPPFGGSNFITDPNSRRFSSIRPDRHIQSLQWSSDPPRGNPSIGEFPVDFAVRRISEDFAAAIFESIQPDNQA